MQEGESCGAVARVREGLRRDPTDVGFSPGDDSTDAEELRLDADPPLSGFEVACDDGVRLYDRRLSHT